MDAHYHRCSPVNPLLSTYHTLLFLHYVKATRPPHPLLLNMPPAADGFRRDDRSGLALWSTRGFMVAGGWRNPIPWRCDTNSNSYLPQETTQHVTLFWFSIYGNLTSSILLIIMLNWISCLQTTTCWYLFGKKWSDIWPREVLLRLSNITRT